MRNIRRMSLSPLTGRVRPGPDSQHLRSGLREVAVPPASEELGTIELLGLPKVLLTVLVAEPAAKHYCLLGDLWRNPGKRLCFRGNDFNPEIRTLISG